MDKRENQTAPSNTDAPVSQPQEEPLHLKNPFKPDEEVVIDQQQLDNEQDFKEAMTERD